jgi:hypothetical protein
LGVDLQETVYALDATTIDLCLSVFPWAVFRSAKAAIKLHTLLDLRGNIPTCIHISDGKVHEVNILTNCCRSRALSTSWIVASSTSSASIASMRPAASS